jgi:hypothetical protein
VEVQDVDVVQPETLEAGIDRSQDPVPTEVPLTAMVGRHPEALGIQLVRSLRRRDEQPSHFRRDHEFVARPTAQRAAEAQLRESETVVRRGVEIADAARPRLGDGGFGGGVGGLGEQVAERGGTEPDFAQHEPVAQGAIADGDLLRRES